MRLRLGRLLGCPQCEGFELSGFDAGLLETGFAAGIAQVFRVASMIRVQTSPRTQSCRGLRPPTDALSEPGTAPDARPSISPALIGTSQCLR